MDAVTAVGDVTAGDDGLAVLVERAVGLVEASGDGNRRAILGVTGAPGAGKTTLVETLVAAVARRRPAGWVAHLPMDGFHLADAQLARIGASNRKGAPDTFDADGYAHMLHRVRSCPEETIYVPGFERVLEQPLAAALVVPPTARLVVTEGNYLLLDDPSWRRARAELAQVWFVTGDQELRVSRLVARHVEFGKAADEAEAWVLGSDESNARLVEAGAARADLLVLNTSAGWHLQA